MPPSVALATIGTTLEIDGVPIGQMMDIAGPNLTTDTDDITNHSSPDNTEEFILTIKRTGEITFPLVFNSGDLGQEALIAAKDDRTIEPFEMRYPDGSGWDFDAGVTGFGMGAPVTGHLSADVTLRPSGAMVRVLAPS